MNARYRIAIGVLAILAGIFFFRWLVGDSIVTLFSPAGVIAASQGSLILTEVSLMLLVAIPMFALLFFTAWKFRSGGNGEHDPEWHGRASQLILWAIPTALVAVLAVLNWQSAHALDPYKPIASPIQPLEVKVVALPWKWLFIYPNQNIATVNFLEFPVNTPVHFDLTADAPMSSFWIPQLGSQIYAMDAMVTQLNLIASTTGDFMGKDTEINGGGYAGMTFTARSATDADFTAWVQGVKQSTSTLSLAAYDELAAPSTYAPPAFYSSVEPGLYNDIVMKFMEPTSSRAAAEMQGNVVQDIPVVKNAQ